MAILVTDQGFEPCVHICDFVGLSEALESGAKCIDLAGDADVSRLDSRLENIQAIRIDFASFADGRGFTLARLLRLSGFSGRLIARGHLIADQYAMARRAGFDAVEISDELAQRQDESQWLFRADWRRHDYQQRLRAVV